MATKKVVTAKAGKVIKKLRQRGEQVKAEAANAPKVKEVQAPKAKAGKAEKAPKVKVVKEEKPLRAMTVSYHDMRLAQAGIRNCRTRPGHPPDIETCGGVGIKAGEIVEGLHGFVVAQTDVTGLKARRSRKFVANAEAMIAGKKFPIMVKTDDVNPGKDAQFSVYKDGSKIKSVVLNVGSGWLAQRGLTGIFECGAKTA